MTTLSAEEFLKITRENPQWAKTLTESVTIAGEVILPSNHPLKALSPKLIFQDHADFSRSRISVAEGVFHKEVNFYNSQIQKIGELTILGTDEKGIAASFWGCKNLTVARGTFPGWVSFAYSGIEEIAEDFHITAPNEKGNAANFWACRNLVTAKGTFSGAVDFTFSGIRKIAQDFRVNAPNKEGNAAYFRYCHRLHIASGTFSGTVDFTETPITHARNLEITVPEGTPKAIFTEPCLEENPFPLREIIISKKLEEKLHRKAVQKLNKNLKNHFPSIPQDIQTF